MDIKKTIELIYDAVTEPELWKEVVDKLVLETKSNSGLFILETLDRNNVLAFNQVGFDEKKLEEYSQHYVSKDIWLERLSRLPTNKFYGTYDVCPQATYLKSEIYNEWGAAQSMQHAVAGYIATNNNVGLRLALQRGASHGAYSQEEVYLLNELEPHLKRAVKLHTQFSELQLLNKNATHILDQLPYAAWLLDQNRVIQYQNSDAETLLSLDSGFYLSGKRLNINFEQQPSFDRMVFETVAAAQGGVAEQDRLFQVCSSKGSPVCELQISPLVTDSYEFGFQYRKVFALVIARRTVNSKAISANSLMELYGLTKKEAALTALLCQGVMLDKMAEITNTSLNTIRTHLKNVFLKTETNSQTQLVSKIFTGIASVSTRLSE